MIGSVPLSLCLSPYMYCKYDYPHISVHLLSPLPLGPGLSIRVICAEEAYICKDFAETNNILKIVTDFSASVKKVRTNGGLKVQTYLSHFNRVCTVLKPAPIRLFRNAGIFRCHVIK